ncbi:hypothetical protein COLO4_08668 [Corchorus olitorius]|uniref:Uncharacterized protein n=1 Tax=Corchorus olitorius TaxID=93759 RepID=A0A1R3KF00_9ROSI|nr:hypothetical protein COLO4_08668 [Corchorus olitorius]
MSTMPEEVATSLNETTRRNQDQPARSTARVSRNGAHAEAEYSGDGSANATAQFASENAERTNGHATANVNTTNQIPLMASTTLHEEVIPDITSPKSVAKMQGRSGNPNVKRSGPTNLQRSVATSTVGSQPSGVSTCIGGSNKQSKQGHTSKKRTRMQGIGLYTNIETGRQILNPGMPSERIINIGSPNRKKTRTHTDQLHGTQESGVEDSSIQSHNPSKTSKGKQKDPWRL